MELRCVLDGEVDDTITTRNLGGEFHTIGARGTVLVEAQVLERRAFADSDFVVVLRCLQVVDVQREDGVDSTILGSEVVALEQLFACEDVVAIRSRCSRLHTGRA